VSCGTKLAVLGNHDLWTDYTAITDTLTAAGATVLVNQAVALPSPWSALTIVGLDDPWSGSSEAATAFAGTDASAARIVLCHGPDGLEAVREYDFHLYLCGHTHGGHLATPWGALVVPEGRLCRRYLAGFARVGAADVFVSRGIGGVEVPFRTWAPPDLLVIDL
jgi:hypothetical protein